MPLPRTLPQTESFGSALAPILPSGSETVRWRRLFGSARGLALAQAARKHQGPVLIITADMRGTQQLEDELHFYLGSSALPVLPFPDWETLPYDAFSPHQDIISQRLLALYRLPTLAQGIVLAPVSTLMHRLAPRQHVTAHTFLLRVGVRLELEPFRQQLADASYHGVSQVMEPGEFAVRGGLLDLFPMGSAQPYRIDLFDEQIESIRVFDPETQRSGEHFGEIRLLPAREYPFTNEATQRFRQEFRARFEGDPQQVPLYRDVSAGLSPPGIEYYLPLFFDRMATLFDYLPENSLVVLEDGIENAAAEFYAEAQARFDALSHDRMRPILPPDQLFLSPAQINDALGERPCVVLAGLEQPGDNEMVFNTGPPPSLPVNHKAETPYGAFLDYLASTPARVLVVAETAGRREILRNLLFEHDLEPAAMEGWHDFVTSEARLGLTCAMLEKGLVLESPMISVITEPQLYGERVAQRRRRIGAARDPESIIKSLAELKPGDPVVHEDHGVGRFLGLTILEAGGMANEVLALEYAGGDKLYIPVTALHLISRYTGTDPDHAPLHKLGSDAWEKAKRRAREKAYDAAAELLEIYALRSARKGHAFGKPDEHYMAFASGFPFEETPDQARVIDDVITDMVAGKPMDRLVCGDVGFGKTEVAMRAAFLAIHGGRQVAVLVPTTLLAQQHFQNFSDRFANLPVKIALMSRFRSKAEQAESLGGLTNGSIDIVIGTHRLLQPDMRFKRLGLVIIDEEHRFGVRQKEQMKKLRAEVDVLTLTATPLPRTLNMALTSLRDISLITTAPQARLAVKTFVVQWNDTLIREACLRELRRGGQVYFLHNDVRTMDKALTRLRELLPQADIRIAHGQMPERELERVMLDFYHQRFNILLCSTIIETGIDVPTANTIIIERADKFGLAQLHQLRGRVGRSHHRAYAYLLVPPAGVMTSDAHKRLEAIAALEELGAGFALASHDLEIRGAGELLGENQSGQIDEIGFSLYTELLNRAVATLRAGKKLDPDQELERPGFAEIDLHVPALLPDTYISDPHVRLILYKRIASAANTQELEELEGEIFDRFGKLPEGGHTLLKVTALKIAAAPLGIRRIEAGPKGAKIEFADKPNVDPSRLVRLLQAAPKRYKLDGATRLRIIAELPDTQARLKAVHEVVQALVS